MPFTGSQAIAVTLKQLGVSHIFGIVGIPVIEVAEACIAEGIEFISFRNEQSAVYAASIYGYMTGKPGVCLVVGGPGLVHALAGVENANANRFPLLLLAGSSETSQKGMGAFQQLDQVSLLRSSGAKFSEQPSSLISMPRLMEQAYRMSFYGKPGTTYIDLPADLIQTKQDALLRQVLPPAQPPRSLGDPRRVTAAALAIKEAHFPLLIIGKGCSYAHAEHSVRYLQSITRMGFIPTPMGKGVVSDSSPENLSAARSQALKNADVILVLGARLNWILHYGLPPKFRADAKFFQVDTVAEELRGDGLGIQGDVGCVAEQIARELRGWKAPVVPRVVLDKRTANEEKARVQEAEVSSGLLKYHPVYRVIRETLARESTKKIIYVSEGANTMDISRTSFPVTEPRTRLDAGTNATMGIGMGYAICAKVTEPNSLVVAIEGDSAFGFSAMEIETAVRSHLPMIIYVMNNSGVYHGSDPALYKKDLPLPSTALSLQTRYHELSASLGGLGFEARTLGEVEAATVEAVHANRVVVINVIIDPAKDKKLEFGWMSSAKL